MKSWTRSCAISALAVGLTSAATLPLAGSSTVGAYGSCGSGIPVRATYQCANGYACSSANALYYQCAATSTGTTLGTSTKSTSATSTLAVGLNSAATLPLAGSRTVGAYGSCGSGIPVRATYQCINGYACSSANALYYQCAATSTTLGTSTKPTSATSTAEASSSKASSSTASSSAATSSSVKTSSVSTTSSAASSTVSSASAVPAATGYANANTSLTIMEYNNLNSSDYSHVPAILLDRMTLPQGMAACANINETLLNAYFPTTYQSDYSNLLHYYTYIGQINDGEQIYVDGYTISSGSSQSTVTTSTDSSAGSEVRPVLCSNSGQGSGFYGSSATDNTTMVLYSPANGNQFVGYRNSRVFQFNGIPYSNNPARFTYSTVNDQTNQVINALNYGADCAQASDSGSSETCLFLNIQTPFIPKLGSTDQSVLKPVIFTIHGGGYTGGSGTGFEGSNFGSREDVVTVSINYRLSTLGFLAVPGTTAQGNYGIGDQLTALRWVHKYISLFGGDPSRITIMGESAGAGSVKALLGSPPVIQENLIAGAVAQSNLGGGVLYGDQGNYATQFSSYYTPQESYNVAGQYVLSEAGCTSGTLQQQVDCLAKLPAATVQGLNNLARYVVQDGSIVNTEQLVVGTNNGSVAHVPVIFGTTSNDGASFFSWPHGQDSEAQFIATSLYISQTDAQRIIDSGLFPLANSGNETLDWFNVTQRVLTDTSFRCVDEAITYAGMETGVFPAAYYYTFARTYGGLDTSNLAATGLDKGPVTPGYPYGNPELPYFKLHASELSFSYGNLYPIRDEYDILTAQLAVGYFASFARSGNPNPPQAYLQARGYTDEINSIAMSGSWDPVSSSQGPAKTIDYPALSGDYPDLAQCTFLNYTLSYYLDGGR